ncbi:hypothetical protein RBB50_001315 [Rhinocladiella similis]
MEEAQMSSEDSGSRPVEDQTKTDSKSSEEASSTASPKSTQLHKPIQVALAEYCNYLSQYLKQARTDFRGLVDTSSTKPQNDDKSGT